MVVLGDDVLEVLVFDGVLFDGVILEGAGLGEVVLVRNRTLVATVVLSLVVGLEVVVVASIKLFIGHLKENCPLPY